MALDESSLTDQAQRSFNRYFPGATRMKSSLLPPGLPTRCLGKNLPGVRGAQRTPAGMRSPALNVSWSLPSRTACRISRARRLSRFMSTFRSSLPACHTITTFITSSPKWLMTFITICHDVSYPNGRRRCRCGTRCRRSRRLPGSGLDGPDRARVELSEAPCASSEVAGRHSQLGSIEAICSTRTALIQPCSCNLSAAIRS